MADPFTLTTADPRFSPTEPLLINGFRFAPATLPQDMQQKLYDWSFNVMLEAGNLPTDDPTEILFGGAVVDFRDLHQILTWAAGTVAGLIAARPDFDHAVPAISERASIAAYLQREADRRKVPGLKRALSIMADNVKAGMDRE